MNTTDGIDMNVDDLNSPETAMPESTGSRQTSPLTRKAILVLGMHRSGTSALTRVISLLGADLPRHLMPPIEGNNPTGFWESREAYEFNNAILESAGSSWDDWRRFNPDWFDSPTAGLFRQQAIALLEKEFEGSPLFVFKDPRVCRLVPFWMSVLRECNADVKVVLAMRNPLEIAASLKERDGFSPSKSHVLWLRHVLEAEYETRALPRVFLSYEALLTNWRAVAGRMAESLAIAWPRRSAAAEVEIDDFLDNAHRHHTIDDRGLAAHPEIGQWVSEAAEAFAGLLRDPTSPGLTQRLDDVHREFDRASDALGPVLWAEESMRRKVSQSLAEKVSALAEREALLATQKDQVAAHEAEIAAGNDRVGEQQREIEALSNETDALRHEVAVLTNNIAAKKDEVEAALNKLGVAEEQRAKAEADATRLQESLMERDNELSLARRSIQHANGHLETLRTEIARRNEEVHDLNRQVSDSEASIAELEASKLQSQQHLSELEAGLERSERKLTESVAQNAVLKNDLSERSRWLADQKLKVEALRSDRSKVLQRLHEVQSLPSWRLFRSMGGHRMPIPTFLSKPDTKPLAKCFGRSISRADRRRIHREAKQLLASNLFDTEWYIDQNVDVALSGGSPVLHWLVVGWQEGRNPNRMFDTSWYLSQYPDVREAGANPLLHYLRFGAQEGRDPSVWFDTSWYVEQNPDVVAAGMNPLRHYLRFGCAEGRRARPPEVSAGKSADVKRMPSSGNAHHDKGEAANASVLRDEHQSSNNKTAVQSVVDSTPADVALLQRIYRYRDIKAKRGKAKVVVYTANIGNYDTPIQHERIFEDWDYVCITDRTVPGIYCWDFRYADYLNADPVRTARFFKTHPHLLFPDYEYSVWIDGNVDIVGDHLHRVVNRLIEDGKKIASVPHPHWSCIYTDAAKCIEYGKDDPGTIREQVEYLKQQGYPEEKGLIETNVMFRSHLDTVVVAAMNDWWSTICRFSRRDQLSFNYVVHKHGLECDSLFEDPEQSTRTHPEYRYYLHPRDRSHAYSYYRIPFFNRNLPNIENDPFDYSLALGSRSGSSRIDDIKVDIIIPVYNALSDVRRCLDSVSSTIDDRCCIVIADDASDEETASWLENFVDSSRNAALIRRRTNVGFTANINGAIRESVAEFVILLNSDTRVSEGWIDNLLNCAYSADDIGLVGPLSNAASWQSIPRIEDDGGGLAINALPPGMTIRDINVFLQERNLHPFYPKVQLLNGFCLGIKRRVFDSVGLFDEEGFPRGYGEEDDFCLRAHEAGFSLAVATNTYVFHAKSKSFGGEQRARIAASSWEVLKARYGVRYLKNAIESSKKHPGLANIRALFSASQTDPGVQELVPGISSRADAQEWSEIEVPSLLGSYDAPATTRDYEASLPYRGESDVRLVAFYLPQFYPFPKNDEIWGKGFTEWTNVTRALPLFKGHHQPKLPDALGFYDTRLKQTLVNQVEMAKSHGIAGFCFHHYFFKKEPVMRVPLELFLRNPDIDFPFCLHWANEPWTTTWTYTYRDASGDTVIYDQEHTGDNDIAFIEDARDALLDPRYIRIDGRPLLMIYRPGLFPDIRATIARWRRYSLENGIGDLHMVMVQTNAEGEQDPRDLGFDAAVEFPPHLIQPRYVHREMKFFYSGFDGAAIDYSSVVQSSLNKSVPEYVQYRGIFPRWDNTPRKIRGTSIFVNDSPESYRHWLEGMIRYSQSHLPAGQRMIFVNAWNEWAEGAFLEPDRKFGYAYLNASARALENTQPVRDVTQLLGPKGRVAIQIHAFHLDVLEKILEALRQGFGYPADLLISTCSEENRRRISDLTSAYRGGDVVIRVFENRGRDIAPFVVGFSDLLPGYALAIHLHTKRSSHGAEFADWLDYLLEELVSDAHNVDGILKQFSHPGVGIVFPRHYWRVKDRIRWGANLARTNEVLKGTGIALKNEDEPFFPSGSMFYFRPPALEALFNRQYTFDDFAAEEGQIDGTLAHAIERSFCYFAQAAGYRSIMR